MSADEKDPKASNAAYEGADLEKGNFQDDAATLVGDEAEIMHGIKFSYRVPLPPLILKFLAPCSSQK
jgi:hypothetical protein